MKNKKGRISSFQTLGTLDGPGVRFVAFLQGCPLRCACCHNPETWDLNGGTEYTAEEVALKAMRYKEYFGSVGGITLSGGEPLMQAEFATEIFRLCKENGINTCLDTSGCILNDKVKELLKLTDYCMLDIKYTTDEQYINNVGCSINKPLEFLEYLNMNNIKTKIRQVIIKGLNDDDDNIKRLTDIVKKYPVIEKTELLAFRKLCSSKYEKLGMKFPLKDIPETLKSEIEKLEAKMGR